MQEKLMSAKELSEYLDIELRTLYRYISGGEIPAIKMGKQWRFRRVDIEKWLEERKIRSPKSAKKVLIASDDAEVQDTLSKALTRSSFEVSAVSDGHAALELLKQKSHPLVIIDTRLPDMSGMEVIAQAKSAHETLKFIVVTGQGSKDAAIEAMNLGVSAYLEKPVKIDDFLKRVEKALEA
ncbi:MAG: response regulator [Candidatus Tectomicrobia bacterium]|nr:response regulator [Candidatus Tectomicrobia bacterium]